jgi:hypothetical protein
MISARVPWLRGVFLACATPLLVAVGCSGSSNPGVDDAGQMPADGGAMKPPGDGGDGGSGDASSDGATPDGGGHPDGGGAPDATGNDSGGDSGMPNDAGSDGAVVADKTSAATPQDLGNGGVTICGRISDAQTKDYFTFKIPGNAWGGYQCGGVKGGPITLHFKATGGNEQTCVCATGQPPCSLMYAVNQPIELDVSASNPADYALTLR